MRIFLCLLLTLVCSFIQAQSSIMNALETQIEFGVNHSYLRYNQSGLDKRYSVEIRLGGLIEASMARHFKARSGLRLGVKPKTNYSFVFPPFSYPLYQIDETLSRANHYFLELPLNILYGFDNFQIGTGLLARHYLNIGGPNGEDFLKGHYETGLQFLFTYKVFEEIKIGGEAYFGINPIFSSYYSVASGSGASYKATNNYVGGSISYRLKNIFNH